MAATAEVSFPRESAPYPWQTVSSPEEFTNGLAYQTFCHVRDTKTPWRVPAADLTQALGLESEPISPRTLAAACTTVKQKRDKLRNLKDKQVLADYLREQFRVPPASTPVQRKPRASSDADVLAQVLPVHGEEKRTSEVAEAAYQSLLVDNGRLQDANTDLQQRNSELKRQIEQIPSKTTSGTGTSTKVLQSPTGPARGTKVLQNPTRPDQELKRQWDRAEHWRGKYFEDKKEHNREMKGHKDCAETKENVKKLQSVISSQRCYYKGKLKEADDREDAAIRHEDCVKKEMDLKARIDCLEDELSKFQSASAEEEPVIAAKEGNVYSTKVRKCIYHVLSRQCPVDHAAEIVAYIAEQFTGKPLTALPSSATVTKMAREMGALSDMQAGEALINSTASTVAWDATEVGGAHINEVHVATPSTSKPRDYVTLSVAQLPGGTTNDYHQHIVQSVGEAAQAYSAWTGEEEVGVLDKIKTNITTSMSDRVAVNHCVVEKLKETVNAELLELNCNLHPLDSLAIKARSTLKATGVTGATFGREAAAVNFVHGMSKMRYKMGKGDPGSFKAYCKDRNIPLKLFPRYVGNRLHILFHLCGIHVYLQEEMVTFLTKFCAARGGLTAALAKDLQNPSIVGHLRVIGLFGKFLTGPWMEAFYTEEATSLDMIPTLKKCVASLEQLEEEPRSLLTVSEDAFGRPLDAADPVLTSLHAVADVDEPVVKSLCTVLLEVCRRQLKTYLADNFTAQQREQAKYAPTHNMQSERIMAMSDAQVHRAPNARLDFIEAKVKAKSNDTLQWLEGMDPSQQEKAVRFAVTYSTKVTAQKKIRQHDTEAEITKRLKQKSRKRDDAERRKVEKSVRELEKEDHVTPAQVNDIFADVPKQIQDLVLTMFNKPADIVRSSFLHTWFIKEQETDIVYHGSVLKIKKTKRSTYVVSYYIAGVESVEDSVDENVTRSSLIVDALYGDLVPT